GDRPSTAHHRPRRPDRRARSWPDHRTRHPRRVAGRRRTLPPALGDRSGPARRRRGGRAMIRTWMSLAPADRRRKLVGFTALAFTSVVVRAAGTVLLVPLVGALFSDAPQRALGWLSWLTAATVIGWVIDTGTARIAFDLGFAVLENTQHDVADRLPDVRLD